MNKPNNYDTVSAGEFTPAQLGGHICIIKDVIESMTKTGKPMIVVRFDFAPDDVQPNYFTNLFKDDIRPDKKWPYAGTAYIVTEDQDGNCTKRFKQFTTAYEKSNEVETVWGQNFANQFSGKLIGAVFGEVEHEYNGKVSMRHELRWFCDVNAAQSADIPAVKYLNGTESAPVRSGSQTGVFAPIDDEELPFN